jgi:hypothetical protein
MEVGDEGDKAVSHDDLFIFWRDPNELRNHGSPLTDMLGIDFSSMCLYSAMALVRAWAQL